MKSSFIVPLVACTLASTACVEYVPVELNAVPPQEEVRVEVTDEAAVRLARHFGRIRQELTASVEPKGADSLSVIVWLGKNYPGTAFENVRETVALDRDEVVSLRRRELSVKRTALLSVGAVAVFAWMVDQIFLQEDPNRGGNGTPPPPPPPALRFNLFRILSEGIPRGSP